MGRWNRKAIGRSPPAQLPRYLLDPVEADEHVLVLQLVYRHRVLTLKDMAMNRPVGGEHQLCQPVNVDFVRSPAFREPVVLVQREVDPDHSASKVAGSFLEIPEQKVEGLRLVGRSPVTELPSEGV